MLQQSLWMRQEMAQAVEQKFPGTLEIHLTKCVSSKGVTFRNGMIVVHGSTSGLPDFGEISQICVVRDSLCFMVMKLILVGIENISEPLN